MALPAGHRRAMIGPMVRYRAVLIKSEECIAASCPASRGCRSQGATKEGALGNTTDAMREWPAAEEDERAGLTVIEAEALV